MKSRKTLALLAIGGLVLAACGSDDDSGASAGTPAASGPASAATEPAGTEPADPKPNTTDGPAVECSTEAGETVTLGNVTDFSGGASTFGIAENQGAQLAVDEINAAGGIESLGGATLEIERYDTATTPDQGATQAQAAVSDGVVAVFGGEVSDTVLAGTNVTQRAGIPWVVVGGGANEIHERGYDTVFQNVVNVGQLTQNWYNVLEDVTADLGITDKTVAIAYTESSYGQEFRENWDEVNADGEYTVVESFGYPLATTDFSAIASRLANSDAEIIFNMGYPADAIGLTRLLTSQVQTDAQIVLMTGANGAAMVSELGEAAEGAIVPAAPTSEWETLPEASSNFIDAYTEAYGEAPVTQAFSGYTSVQFLAAALESAGCTDGAAIVEGLRGASLDHDTGNVWPSPEVLKFKDDGSLEEAGAFYAQIQGGASKAIFPLAIAQAEPIAFP